MKFHFLFHLPFSTSKVQNCLTHCCSPQFISIIALVNITLFNFLLNYKGHALKNTLRKKNDIIFT